MIQENSASMADILRRTEDMGRPESAADTEETAVNSIYITAPSSLMETVTQAFTEEQASAVARRPDHMIGKPM